MIPAVAPVLDLAAKSQPVKQPVTMKLRLPNQAHLFEHIKTNAKHAKDLIAPDSRIGKSVAICGGGPTLATQFPVGDEVWACNSALPYLLGRSIRVTHGFCIDQGEEMLRPHEWGTAPDVKYLVASSVHPTLVEHLLAKGRELTFFHSFLGIPDPDGWKSDTYISHEMELYATLYGTKGQRTGMVGHGLNSVGRAICLALGMGFSEIIVYGNDCCAAPAPPIPGVYGSDEYAEWVSNLVMYADGRTAAEAFGHGTKEPLVQADFDGRLWHTRPDMSVSAQHEVELCEAFPGRVRFMGDTLPKALLTKDTAFRALLPKLTGFGELSNFGNVEFVNKEEAA